jgi:hypothetical protein
MWCVDINFHITTDNHYVLDAKTPENQGTLMIGFEGTMDMVRDERMKAKNAPGQH